MEDDNYSLIPFKSSHANLKGRHKTCLMIAKFNASNMLLSRTNFNFILSHKDASTMFPSSTNLNLIPSHKDVKSRLRKNTVWHGKIVRKIHRTYPT